MSFEGSNELCICKFAVDVVNLVRTVSHILNLNANNKSQYGFNFIKCQANA